MSRNAHQESQGSTTRVPIVLTGTIVPRILAGHNDYRVRRDEYLSAIEYYSSFSKVYFLENSTYDLNSDRAFRTTDAISWHKFTHSLADARLGKGHCEFKMLDEFVLTELRESSFIKITGRYIYTNFDSLWTWLQCLPSNEDFVVDCIRPGQWAVTSLCFMSKWAYLSHLLSAHKEMDDRRGATAESVVYRRLSHVRTKTFWSHRPLLVATDGYSGQKVASRRKGIGLSLKNTQRRTLRMLGAQELMWV